VGKEELNRIVNQLNGHDKGAQTSAQQIQAQLKLKNSNFSLIFFWSASGPNHAQSNCCETVTDRQTDSYKTQ
jgi:hypothetical protein